MGLWVVVGGQYGSEGKGKIAASIATRHNLDLAIRCGGPNSGHSFVDRDGSLILVRELPTALVNRRTRLLIPAGAVVDLSILRDEMLRFDVSPDRVGVDRNAMIITPGDKLTERSLELGERISSTLCGVGAATARRVMRGIDATVAGQAAKSEPWLSALVTDVAEEANASLDRGDGVLIEGTQGFGLSLFHSHHYPKTTSKDTTAAAFLSEVGISPLRVTEIVLVLRTFPIRVSGAQAGPMHEEVTWEQVRAESGSPLPLTELTTVSRMVRRVGRFDWDLAKRAVMVNKPTRLAINCIDHLDYQNRNIIDRDLMSEKATDFLSRLSIELGTPIGFIGTGPSLCDVSSYDDSISCANMR